MAEWWEKDQIVAPAAASKPAESLTPEQRSTLEDIGRQIGLTVRAGVSGAAALPAMASDAITGAINAGLDVTVGKDKGFRFQAAQQALGNMMTAAGLPKPENATERVVQDVATGMAGAGGFVGAGNALMSAGGPVARSVGSTLAAGPGLQTVSGAAGAGAMGVTREAGGGEAAQVAAGVAGALAPGFALPAVKGAARVILRGGEAGRQTVANNIAAFEAAGTTPTLGQATGGRVARATESLLARTPGGAGVMAKRAQQQVDDMAEAVQKLSDDLAPNASAANAGEAIVRGIQAFKDGIKAIQTKLYSELDLHIPGNAPVTVTNTQAALKALTDDIPGAESLSSMFKNTRIIGLSKSMKADLDAAAVTGTLPYSAVKQLRTLVGRELADGSLVPDVPRAQWSALYGALSDDLGEAAVRASPRAESVWAWANQFTKQQMTRLEQLSGIVSRDTPEKVFNASISGTAEGSTIVKRVFSALPKQERREVAAAVLQRMGRATAGQQNAMGDAFSSETFLSNLSKMSLTARQAIFGRTSISGVMEKVQQLATVAESRRAGGQVFANPSGTAGATAQAAVGTSIGGGALWSGLTGNPGPLLGALGAPAGANLVARGMVNPKLAQFAAEATPLAPGALPSALAATTRLEGDPQPAAPNWRDTDTLVEQAPGPGAPQGELPHPDALTTPPAAAPAAQTSSAPAPVGSIAAIGQAATVDEAIAAAQAAIDSGPHVQLSSAPPPPPPVPIVIKQAPDPRPGAAPGQEQPVRIWVGRRGDGYGTADDAVRALQARQKADPSLEWRVEQMPNELFRLAGYPLAQQAAAAPFQASMTPNGNALIRGDIAGARAFLLGLGIHGLPTRDGLVIGRNQSQAALQALGEFR